MKLRILSLAEADLLDGFRFYERQQRGLGMYFLASALFSVGSDAINGMEEPPMGFAKGETYERSSG